MLKVTWNLDTFYQISISPKSAFLQYIIFAQKFSNTLKYPKISIFEIMIFNPTDFREKIYLTKTMCKSLQKYEKELRYLGKVSSKVAITILEKNVGRGNLPPSPM